MKGKNTEPAKSSSLCIRRAKCSPKSCAHPSGTEVLPPGVVTQPWVKHEQQGGHLGCPHCTPSHQTGAFPTNWDISLGLFQQIGTFHYQNESGPAMASIEEKLPWYQMPPKRGTSPASDRVENVSLWINSEISCSNFTPSHQPASEKPTSPKYLLVLRAKVMPDKGCVSKTLCDTAMMSCSNQHEETDFCIQCFNRRR